MLFHKKAIVFATAFILLLLIISGLYGTMVSDLQPSMKKLSPQGAGTFSAETQANLAALGTAADDDAFFFSKGTDPVIRALSDPSGSPDPVYLPENDGTVLSGSGQSQAGKDFFSFLQPFSHGGIVLLILLSFFLLAAFFVFFFYFYKIRKLSYESRIRREELNRYFAYTDALTKLPNRKGAKLQFETWGKECRNERGTGCALLLDMDHLQSVNKAFGHDAGDAFLRETAERLKAAVDSKDLVARIGSDEFAVLVCGADTDASLKALAQKLLLTIRNPYLINGMVIQMTCSIGALFFDCRRKDGGALFDDILSRGEFVLAKAKSSQKGGCAFFSERDAAVIDRQAKLERNLKLSIACGELLPYFQPQYDCRAGGVFGFEVLARWKSSELGMIPPDQFIPIAERSGFIKDLGRFMMEKAFAFSKKMEGRGMTVSFNASPAELLETNYADYAISRFDFYGLKPRSVAIEITESCLIESFDRVVKKLELLREHGIQIYLDDFGTGFSSLTYLKNLPIDAVKIDKSFLCEIATDDMEKDIVGMIIQLSRRLNLKIIAEGAETGDQVRCVCEAGCKIIQGYYISRPVPEENVLPLLDEIAGRGNRLQSPG